MAVSTAMIKELREATGAGILDSKKALEAVDGDFDKAVELLREKGLAKAAKKASREANEGQIAILVKEDGASLVEVNCETDFVARTDNFQTFVNSIAQHIFDNPQLSSLDDLLASEHKAFAGQAVSSVIQEHISKLGENIVVKRFERYTMEGPGLIEGYLHPGGRIGVLVEVSVADAANQGDILNELSHDLALQIAAVRPQYLSRQDVPAEIVAKEREIFMAQLAEDKKPDNIKEKIVEGKLRKFFEENCLLEQAFVKDDKMNVEQLLKQKSKELGAPITIKRFTRFELGDS
ncbi:MAG TPA: elongation factor Ts [Anaerolineae bacterium]|nr:elongation factor Ts [Anaerolineae bacterium]